MNSAICTIHFKPSIFRLSIIYLQTEIYSLDSLPTVRYIKSHGRRINIFKYPINRY